MSSLDKFNDSDDDFKGIRFGEDHHSHALLLSEFSKFKNMEKHHKRRLFLMIGTITLLCINLLWSFELFFISIHDKKTGPNLINCEFVRARAFYSFLTLFLLSSCTRSGFLGKSRLKQYRRARSNQRL